MDLNLLCLPIDGNINVTHSLPYPVNHPAFCPDTMDGQNPATAHTPSPTVVCLSYATLAALDHPVPPTLAATSDPERDTRRRA